MTQPCNDPACSSTEQIRALAANDAEQSRRIDKILSILTDSTLDGGSVVDRLRKHEAEIKELKEAKRDRTPSLWDTVLRKSIETVTQAFWAGVFLLLTRGIIAEIVSKGHP